MSSGVKDGFIQFDIEGVKELEGVFSALPKRTSKQVLRNGLKLAAKPIAAAAKMNLLASGWDSKEASDSVRIRAMKNIKVDAAVTIGPDSKHWYAALFEYGFRSRRPEPWLRPAWDAEARMAYESLSKYLLTALDKLAQRLTKQAYSGKLSREGRRALGL